MQADVVFTCKINPCTVVGLWREVLSLDFFFQFAQRVGNKVGVGLMALRGCPIGKFTDERLSCCQVIFSSHRILFHIASVLRHESGIEHVDVVFTCCFVLHVFVAEVVEFRHLYRQFLIHSILLL